MSQELTLFVGMFTTLLAIINSLEALPVYLEFLESKDEAELQRLVRRSCFYALLLAFFFLFFGKLILRIFGVPLSMVRIVGGIILMRIGFDLFSPFKFRRFDGCRSARLSPRGSGRRLHSTCDADHVWTGSHCDHPWYGFDRQTLRIRICLRGRHLFS